MGQVYDRGGPGVSQASKNSFQRECSCLRAAQYTCTMYYIVHVRWNFWHLASQGAAGNGPGSGGLPQFIEWALRVYSCVLTVESP